MSKHNINPDHFKTAGRGPQANDILTEVNRREYAEERAREKRETPVVPVPAEKGDAGQEEAAERREEEVDRKQTKEEERDRHKDNL